MRVKTQKRARIAGEGLRRSESRRAPTVSEVQGASELLSACREREVVNALESVLAVTVECDATVESDLAKEESDGAAVQPSPDCK